MKEENKYPNYLSKPSGVEVFPRGRSEYQGLAYFDLIYPNCIFCWKHYMFYYV